MTALSTSGMTVSEFFAWAARPRGRYEPVIHHARNPAGEIATRILSGGELVFDPRGITVPIEPLLPEQP